MLKNILLSMILTLLFLHIFHSKALSTEIELTTGNGHRIYFMTGGVGKGERAEMEKASRDCNLKIVLAEVSGAYLALIPIAICDNNGTQVLRVEGAGPWLYAHLPNGRYTIKTYHSGEVKEKTVWINQGREVVMFHWNKGTQ